jgi:hypothetical protein
MGSAMATSTATGMRGIWMRMGEGMKEGMGEAMRILGVGK